MLLGGIIRGEQQLDEISSKSPRRTIAGYIDQRIRSPYLSPEVGSRFVIQVHGINNEVPRNLFLVVGDEELEVQASRVSNATGPGPADAWRLVHGWISDLIADILASWNVDDSTVFIDCNPSFSIYTELAMSASVAGIHLWFRAPMYVPGAFRRRIGPIWQRGGEPLSCRSEMRMWNG